MAGASTHHLPEHWTELNAARKQRRLCAENIHNIARSCTAHGKNLLECNLHFHESVDRMFARYNDYPHREWFSQRKAFVYGLETMFADMIERLESEQRINHGELDDIEANIESEKEAWYRWVLRRHPEFLAIASGVNQNEVRSILDDPDRSREELVAMVWEAVGKPADWSSRVDIFIEKVAAAAEDPAELKKLYIAEFFKDHKTGETLENAQKYLEQYESASDASLEDVIGCIISANKGERGLQARREVYHSRLEELRRAKTAFERDKALAKSRARASQAVAVGDELYDLPSCSMCQQVVDSKDVLSCPVCQIGDERKLTVYCSEVCYHKGQGEHIEQSHDCEAGNICSREGDEDDDMEDDASGPVSCNDCLHEQKVTLFCSPRCAAQNLSSHREAKHGLTKVMLNGNGVQSLVTPLQQVIDSSIKKCNPGLTFTWMDS